MPEFGSGRGRPWPTYGQPAFGLTVLGGASWLGSGKGIPSRRIGLAWCPPEATYPVYRDARAGRFQILLVWALDSGPFESRGSISCVVHRLVQFGVQVWSYQEPWTEAGGELLHPLLTIAGWIAMMESNRRSERTNTNSVNRPHINPDRLLAGLESNSVYGDWFAVSVCSDWCQF